MKKQLCVLYALVSYITCYKILVYSPRIGHSHIEFMGRLADILTEAGHDVTVFIAEMNSEMGKVNGTKLARIIVGPHFESPANVSTVLSTTWANELDSISTVLKGAKMQYDWQINFCLSQLKDAQLLESLKNENFDFGIVEIFWYCGYAIYQKIGLKSYATAITSDLVESLTDQLGVSSTPSFVPTMYCRSTDQMNYKERIKNVISYMLMSTFASIITWLSDRRLSNYVEENWQVQKMIEQSSLALINSDEVFQFPRLTSPKIVFIGGIAVNEPQKLDKVYENILNISSAGTVLVSFGTVVQSHQMPEEMKQSFVNMFSNMSEITFIWKYEIDDNVGKDVNNLYKKKWVPQRDLLGSGRITVFVSHCGKNSLTESVYSGVPIICIPLYADQMRNARLAEKHGIGIYISKYEITAKKLKDVLQEFIYNKKYRDASRRLASMLRDKPISSRERLIKHVEFAAKYGQINNFDIAGNRLNFLQYYLLDIIIPVIIVLAAIIYFCIRFVVCIWRCTLKGFKEKKE